MTTGQGQVKSILRVLRCHFVEPDVSDRDGDNEIYLMKVAGDNLTRLTDHPANDVSPAWSPDGQQLAFASNRGGNLDVYVINADGTGLVRLTEHPADDGFPT